MPNTETNLPEESHTTWDWEPHFRATHSRAVQAWLSGRRSPDTMFSKEDTSFLQSIGCSNQELFDFVDDLEAWGAPDLESVLDIQRVRYTYFIQVQNGRPSPYTATMESLPPKGAALDGIPWLPRLIVKARLKLRGEMPPDLMYGCGGDRPFVARMRTTLADFLRLVWECGTDDRRIVDSLKKSAGPRHP